jgi:hypothetical protein
MEAADADAVPCIDGDYVNEAEPRPEDAPGGDSSALRSLRGPGSCPPRAIAPGDATPAPGSSNIVDLGVNELELPGYPRAPPLPTSWR